MIAILHNWCAYTSTNLAGTSRSECPHNIHIVRLMCFGSADPVFVLKLLLDGVVRVITGGCNPLKPVISIDSARTVFTVTAKRSPKMPGIVLRLCDILRRFDAAKFLLMRPGEVDV